jgi:thymidine phosphorylase
MPGRKPRERVVAEITLAHLTQVAREIGRSLSAEEAVDFLSQNGRAYEMWKRMMHAGEEYLKSALQAPRPCPSRVRARVVAVWLCRSFGVRRSADLQEISRVAT